MYACLCLCLGMGVATRAGPGPEPGPPGPRHVPEAQGQCGGAGHHCHWTACLWPGGHVAAQAICCTTHSG